MTYRRWIFKDDDGRFTLKGTRVKRDAEREIERLQNQFTPLADLGTAETAWVIFVDGDPDGIVLAGSITTALDLKETWEDLGHTCCGYPRTLFFVDRDNGWEEQSIDEALASFDPASRAAYWSDVYTEIGQ